MHRSQAVQPPASSSAQGGISQLRRSADEDADQHADLMNLDDFIVPTSVASPTAITPHSATTTQAAPALNTNQQAAPVPINTKEKPQVQIPPAAATAALSHPAPPASSVPKSSIPGNRSGEFDYVPRRVRKTSVDERRVGQM